MKLEGKVALVTGAGKGIGNSIAHYLAGEGADVAINDINLHAAEETANEITSMGRKAIAIKADVSQPREVDQMIDTVVEKLGGIHILVNNAGTMPGFGATIDSSVEYFEKGLDVHLKGTYLCSRGAAKWMIANKKGKIINISSLAAFGGGLPIDPSYGSAKAGIMLMTRHLAVEWGQFNINVNCIAPGFILTQSSENLPEKVGEERTLTIKHTPLRRFGLPDDIAKAVVFLVSEDASFISGVTIPVDGGWLANIYL